jgi:hypothetical protein
VKGAFGKTMLRNLYLLGEAFTRQMLWFISDSSSIIPVSLRGDFESMIMFDAGACFVYIRN